MKPSPHPNMAAADRALAAASHGGADAYWAEVARYLRTLNGPR